MLFSILRCQRTLKPTTLPTQRRYIPRSAFNIASYALLLQMVAQVTGLQTGDFVHTLGDTHIYTNHLEQVKLQLSREPRSLPQMKINPDIKDIFSFKYEDFELVNYDPWPHIAGKVSV